MKCDLKNVWADELRKKEYERKEAARREEIRQANQRLADEVERLKGLGWEFKCEEWCHPHNNTLHTESVFRSPRMHHFCNYDLRTNFAEAEARSLAYANEPRVKPCFEKALHSALFDYYLKNPSVRGLPKLTINIIDEQKNQVSCMVG